MSEVTRIPVGEDYEVVVGRGVSSHVAGLLPDAVRQVLVVHPQDLAALADPVIAALRDAGLIVHAAGVPDAEAAKTVQVAADLWSRLGQAAFTRSDAVVAVGGGSVTDLAGFVAATWLRGVAVVHVPTTVLGMVDAAVGGKTGINTPEGKNLVGSFHPPAGVLCDLDTLDTLPEVDRVAGLAEVVKGGWIADPVILDLVEKHGRAALDPSSPVLRELVERKISVKARVVAADLKESSLREILNYGHTFGHAIELAEGYRMRHGDAVAIGMVYAAELAHAAGTLGVEDVARHRAVNERLGLPTRWTGTAGFDELRVAMGRDKKTRGATLRFVTLTSAGHPTRLVGPDEALLRTAYEAVTA